MPNNVSNSLKITGPQADLQKIALLMKSKESAFDFNKIIPKPGVFRDLCYGGCTIDGVDVTVWREVEGKPVAIPEKTLARWRAKYGADNWYDWAIENWGTKWNAYDVSFVDCGRVLHYDFTTAWCSPEPIIDALKTEFPSCTFHVDVGGEVDEPYCYTR